MNEFKDKVVILGRLYIFAVPMVFIIGFAFCMLSCTFDPEFFADAAISNKVLNNIVSSLAFGFGAAGEITVIYLFIQFFRKNKVPLRVLLCIALIPAMIIFIIPACIFTIPYYIYTIRKMSAIKTDNSPVFSKPRITALIIASIIGIVSVIISMLN